MSKNLIPEVVKLLGVEIGEEFRIDNAGSERLYKIDEFGNLMYAASSGGEWGSSSCFNITSLLSGHHYILKVPYNPQPDKEFWYVSIDGVVYAVSPLADTFRFYLIKSGNCFRTEEEARANSSRIKKEIFQ